MAPAISSLRVRGPFRGAGGYDHHVREFVRELTAQGVAVQLVDLPEWGSARLAPGQLERWYDRLSSPVGAAITLHFTMPHQVVSDGTTRDVNYTMFEATRAPAGWLEANRQHELVIVPHESSRMAWLAGGFPSERIALCPLGIDPRRFDGRATPLPLRDSAGRRVADYRLRFLNVSEAGPRKNLSGLLHAWLDATRRDDDALLLIKLGRPPTGWFELLRRQLPRIEERAGRRFAGAAPVEFLFDVLSDAEMPQLYAAATHYISLSHGEGWDQPMVEAAASGLRLIAPDHSAYRAYLTPDSAVLLPCRQVPAHAVGDPGLQQLFDGADWWEPDHEAAVAAIRAALAGGGPPSDAARCRIMDELTWERVTRRLIELLAQVSP